MREVKRGGETFLEATEDNPNAIVDGMRRSVKKGDLFTKAADGYFSVDPSSVKSDESDNSEDHDEEEKHDTPAKTARVKRARKSAGDGSGKSA